MNYKVSVVTVCYNAENEIEKTINSVISQSYINLEFIIVDGGSSDHTLDIIKRYISKIDILISENDRGIYDAMNKGIRAATGEWIIFMNCSDSFASNNIIRNVFSRTNLDSFSAIYGNAIMDNKGRRFLFVPRPFYTKDSLPLSSGICHQSVFFRSSIIKDLLYNTKYKVSADYDLMLRLYLINPKILFIKEAICIFDTSEGFSARNRVLALKECAIMTNQKQSFKYIFQMLMLRIRIFIKSIVELI